MTDVFFNGGILFNGNVTRVHFAERREGLYALIVE